MTREGALHVVERRPRDAAFCLAGIALVLENPLWVGRRTSDEVNRIELAGMVGDKGRLLLVGVKFLDDLREAWVCTANPWSTVVLTRRLRNGTMQEVRRGS